MLQSITNWLQKPYPFPQKFSVKLLTSLGFGKFIFVFLLIFKPFNFSDLSDKVVFYALLYGLITFIIVFLNYYILPIVFPKFFKQNSWVIYKMFLFVLLILFTISFANWFFSRSFLFKENVVNHSLIYSILITFSTGFFPILFLLYITEKIKTKKHKLVINHLANAQVKKPISKPLEVQNITIFGANKNEVIHLSLNELLYIGFEKNYVSIFSYKDNKLNEQILRSSLSAIAQQLSEYKFIVRCHKSYIVNTLNAVKIDGNARGYLLQIAHSDLKIPVSRSFPKELLYTLVSESTL